MTEASTAVAAAFLLCGEQEDFSFEALADGEQGVFWGEMALVDCGEAVAIVSNFSLRLGPALVDGIGSTEGSGTSRPAGPLQRVGGWLTETTAGTGA